MDKSKTDLLANYLNIRPEQMKESPTPQSIAAGTAKALKKLKLKKKKKKKDPRCKDKNFVMASGDKPKWCKEGE